MKVSRRRWRRRVAVTLGLALALVGAAHPLALAASDVWGNVGPASPLGSGGLYGRYPLGHYALDQHFDAVSASLTGGVDVSGVPPMIAYFFASVLWALTSFLASALISLFAFAFSLDLLNGSSATGGAGALAPVAQAIHSIYAGVFGGPWLVLAVSLTGIWAMWKALVQRRYSETAGALALSLIYVVAALFFVAEPAKTIGAASEWTNKMSVAFLSVTGHGSASGGSRARDGAAEQLFDLLVFRPWAVMEFGGLEHCAVAGTGSEDSDPDSVAVRPLAPDAGTDAALARRLATGTEVAAGRKSCVNNANKYGSHFLGFGLGTDERNAEYDALDHGDASKLPDSDPERRGYRLTPTDKPASDAMEAGGQYQRLLIAIVVFGGELGAFCLLGALAVGVILAQILLLVCLAFAPVALVAAAIPGRGHAFFRGWLEKLVGFLLRKAAYSLVLAVLLAVNGALAAATSSLGWLMSFGLQALFFWAVFLQRRKLTESLVGLATGPGAPGRDASLRLLGLYYGARAVRRPFRRSTGAPAASRGPSTRLHGGGSGSRRGDRHAGVGLAGGPSGFADAEGGSPAGRNTAPGGSGTASGHERRAPHGESTPAPEGAPLMPPSADETSGGREARGELPKPERSGEALEWKSAGESPDGQLPEPRSKRKVANETPPKGEEPSRREATAAEPPREDDRPEKGEEDLASELRAERERGEEPRDVAGDGESPRVEAPPRRRSPRKGAGK
jgi:hypothetical protein